MGSTFKGKYKFNQSTHSYDFAGSFSSFRWEGIVLVQNLLNKGLSWRLDNVREVLFWEDCWCNGRVLKDFGGDNLNINWNFKVGDLFQNGFWNLEALNLLLPMEIVQEVVNIPVAFENNIFDQIVWAKTVNGFLVLNQRILF